MSYYLIQFVTSACVIVVAGSFLTRFADTIAEVTGWGRLLIGSILLAGATSLPELAVDLQAIQLQEPDLAVGDLMGSSLMNLLILACLDLGHSSRGRMLSRLSASHALPATVSIALTALAALAIFLGPVWTQTWLGLGPGSWILLIAYTLGVRLVFFDQRVSAAQALPTQKELFPDKKARLLRAGIGFGCATLVIVVTAPLLASSAASLAEQSGLGGTFVGTTLVAISTSLPELVSAIAAIRINAFDLAVGNVFGSNSFNMFLLVILDAAHPGSLFSSVSDTHLLTALATIVISAVAILGQLYQVEKRRSLLEPDAVLVLGLIIAALALLYCMK